MKEGSIHKWTGCVQNLRVSSLSGSSPKDLNPRSRKQKSLHDYWAIQTVMCVGKSMDFSIRDLCSNSISVGRCQMDQFLLQFQSPHLENDNHDHTSDGFTFFFPEVLCKFRYFM